MAEKKLSLFFDCPNCGDKGRVMGAMKAEEVAKEKFGVDIPVGSRQLVVPVIDPRRPSISHPIVVIIYDICAKCGFESPREVHYGTAQPQLMKKPRQGQGGGFSPS